MNKRKKEFLKIFIRFILFPILLSGFFVFPARAEWANHLVISAVQTTEGEGKTTHDFIEIYNPTTADINLKGYRLVKRAKAAIADSSIKSWTKDAIIKAHGWRLWVSSNDAAFPESVNADDSTSYTIADDSGIAIRLGAEDTGEIVDSLAWGAAENIFKEGNAPPNPGAGEALTRKPGNGSGNGDDSNNNADDFTHISGFAPRNSLSAAEPPVNATGNNDSAANSGNNISSPSPSPAAASQPRLPVAEAGSDKEGITGENIDFDGSDSVDPLGEELDFQWDFGDGQSTVGENVSHAYNSAGEYKVILKVSNSAGTAEDFLNAKISEPEFSDKIILSELLPDPVGSDKDGEWVELANVGGKAINLRGWILDDAISGGGKPYNFSENIFIGAGEFLVVKRAETGLILPNKGGEINLLWYNGKILSNASWGQSKEGESYALFKSAWQWTKNPTPGKQNMMSQNLAGAEKLSASSKAAAGAETESRVSPARIANRESGSGASADNSDTTLMALEASDAGEKISAAFPQEKISEANNSETNGKDTAGGDTNGTAGYGANGGDFSENNSDRGKTREEKSNPWFWGDMALSALSLLLVWRYQGLRKKIK